MLAMKVIGYVPVALATPLSVAVPSPLSLKETPVGSAPVSVMDGVGVPVVATVKETGEPAVKPALLALVIAGA